MARIDEDDFDTEAPTTEATVEAQTTEATPEAAVVTTEVTEGTPEGQPTEGTEPPAEGTESAEDEAAKKAAEAKAAQEEYDRLFKEFTEAADAAVKAEDVDRETGHLHEGLKAPVSKAYTAMPGAKGKNAAKQYLQEKMQQGMLDGVEDPTQYVVARSYLQLFKEVPKEAGSKATGGGDKPTVVVDPTEAFVARIAALLIAPNLTTVPEGVSDDWKDKAKAKAQELQGQVASYRNWLTANVGKSDEEKSAKPEVDAIVEAAAKVASGRAAGKAPRKAAAGGTSTASGTAYSGPRRNVVEHIRQAFADKPVGTWMSNAEIAKFQSTEYGDDRPSSGAVSARLFKKDENEVWQPQELADAGVRGEERDHKGAVKVADVAAA